ncbi:branched-chain amino acid ABC transporter permease [Marinomonas mediterranea]|jgi:amino acid/amide ABC transporter membrane protein 1, HAAT family (TC 3.A.1.4.-)|uniref:ABC-type transporter, integral membrane subunit n=1 Tax=Marinomonas mediterranea (strain ATCC 700492 / JCM 21426 / NBRC 103028 / MMB-1) TaxID=717774 RepID=F2JYW3_MARM1|nr:branched-chain amino acid ABC transporter permease [Marinomonas mediterranea]ADZ90828.1 ABC-type transporter, integral membrane subunit [Marinomonas mediterranea MMB-1]WCN08878.1 branched-chain amino acid ABC transporter permease [Marinomonas mediterranea]WCN12912.1 branched-chain amino acid ABC transporter permease [Marinomonas mediterranea]WCN16981.1 branched-chain amino acid ABC transporter permease [Marinomonas mediterranea MMB-1]
MDSTLFFVQLINGLQYGLLLFLIASGLTLVFGVMGILNLAHGSMFMVGAYLAWYFVQQTGSFAASAAISAVIALLIGFVVERTLIRRLYKRNHLDQVLLTIGMIFVFNAMQGLLWGNDPLGVDVPEALSASIPLTGIIEYPVYRIFVALFCVVVAVGMYYVINKTRLGMLIRAGESDREMVECLGIDINRLYTIVFAIGVMLSAVAGVVAAPISSIVPGMGEHILITCFVVVVIGGMGSIKGAFIGALMVGLVDTFASVLVPELSSMMIYIFMAFILLIKPQGLFSS